MTQHIQCFLVLVGCFRLARAVAFPLWNTPTPSSQRDMQRLVSSRQRALMNSCCLKALDSCRKENGEDCLWCFDSPLIHLRYANVDYIVARSTSHNPEPRMIASYDIMCQWATNLQDRLAKFPIGGSVGLNDRIVARVVPKFHLAAHRPECRANFSLNFEPGAGRKDMEGPERTWFGLQGGGTTKDQGPGFWSDTMDDKFAHWNWTKLVSFGKSTFMVGGYR